MIPEGKNDPIVFKAGNTEQKYLLKFCLQYVDWDMKAIQRAYTLSQLGNVGKNALQKLRVIANIKSASHATQSAMRDTRRFQDSLRLGTQGQLYAHEIDIPSISECGHPSRRDFTRE